MKRKTIQRVAILETVRRLKSHPTADEVFAEVSLEHPMISRGTVYRNLKQLAENGDLYSIEIPGCANCYDHRCFDHYHARCINCCKVFDVDMDYVSDLEKRIKNPSDFAFTGYDLIFKGYCHECQEKL